MVPLGLPGLMHVYLLEPCKQTAETRVLKPKTNSNPQSVEPMKEFQVTFDHHWSSQQNSVNPTILTKIYKRFSNDYIYRKNRYEKTFYTTCNPSMPFHIFHACNYITSRITRCFLRRICPRSDFQPHLCGRLKGILVACCGSQARSVQDPKKTGWWFQPIWKILVKWEIFPK